MQEELSRTETEDSDSVANSLDENSWSDSNHVDGPMSVTVSLVYNKLARYIPKASVVLVQNLTFL